MDFPDAILLEDWLGLESETERLLITYGYPTESGNDFAVEEIQEPAAETARSPSEEMP